MLGVLSLSALDSFPYLWQDVLDGAEIANLCQNRRILVWVADYWSR